MNTPNVLVDVGTLFGRHMAVWTAETRIFSTLISIMSHHVVPPPKATITFWTVKLASKRVTLNLELLKEVFSLRIAPTIFATYKKCISSVNFISKENRTYIRDFYHVAVSLQFWNNHAKNVANVLEDESSLAN